MDLLISLHDNEGTSHKETRLIFENEATIAELKETIYSTWSIDKKYQELFCSGRVIHTIRNTNTLIKAGIKDDDTIIVKHTRLDNWAQFTKMVEIAREARKVKKEHKIKEAVNYAINQLKGFKEADFFLAYPALLDTFTCFNKEFAHYVDTDHEYMTHAAQYYFSKLFNDDLENPTVESMCNPNPKSGAQGGLICRITKNGVDVGSYYIKPHLGLTPRSSSNPHYADLRELFVYRLLELIKVGPVVHFLPNVYHSTFGLYIATQEVQGFRTAAEVRMGAEQMYQLELLQNAFYLIDLHTSNYGLDSDGQLCVVDFQIGSHAGSGKAALEKYLKGQKELRVKVGKDCFRAWGFPETLDEADDRITNQKNFFEKKPIYFEVSEDYKKYFKKVKDNIKIFSECFNNAD